MKKYGSIVNIRSVSFNLGRGYVSLFQKEQKKSYGV
jgi:hypothetical protein